MTQDTITPDAVTPHAGTPDAVLAFWFADGPATRREIWFKRDDGFDASCGRFRSLAAAALRGELEAWAATPHGALALLLLLDQFPRNLFRGSPDAFAGDAMARRIAGAAIGAGFYRELTPVERLFLYLPFEHSEDLADQDRSVALFESLATAPQMESTLVYALAHRDVIRRFGRFPHRNSSLGRTSTPAEIAYLAEPGSGF